MGINEIGAKAIETTNYKAESTGVNENQDSSLSIKDKVVQGSKDEIAKLQKDIADMKQDLRENGYLESAGKFVKDTANKVKDAAGEVSEACKDTIEEHPVASTIGAGVLGTLAGYGAAKYGDEIIDRAKSGVEDMKNSARETADNVKDTVHGKVDEAGKKVKNFHSEHPITSKALGEGARLLVNGVIAQKIAQREIEKHEAQKQQ